MHEYELTDLIYDNRLESPTDVNGFVLEGDAAITFPLGRMRMENLRDPEEGQAANFVCWCPEDFSADIAVEWDFWPVREPGLCIFFFSARGRGGEDLLDPRLKKRTGEYQMYHHGDINAYHVSYFRRHHPEERAFHTCNLRKSYGFHLACQGADPIPSIQDTKPPYHVRLLSCGGTIAFSVNDLTILTWTDDGVAWGPCLNGGKLGFRQMAPLIGEYANLKVYRLT